MMAACNNVTTYAAAQVFYWVGFNGMAYVLDVFMADTSSLKNRALVFAFSQTPYIVTTFAGPRGAQSFLETSGWRWGFGVFCIVTPVIAMPILAVLWKNQRKAIREGLLVRKRSGRTLSQNITFYFWEFDGNNPQTLKHILSTKLIQPSNRLDPHHRSICIAPSSFLTCLLPD
jgi:MFS family permease